MDPMAGDGISLQTTLSQLGNVAKTQAKGQQSNPSTTPLSEQLDKSKDLKVDRVKQTEKAEQQRIDPDKQKERDKRRRRRRRRPEDEAAADKTAEGDPLEAEAAPDVGRLVDTRA
jgi:membrane protein involved in colicin uptake